MFWVAAIQTRKNAREAICEKRDSQRANQKQDASRGREPLQFTEEQTDHKRGLQRADTAASFTHADESVVDTDQASFELRRNPEQAHSFSGDRRDDAH